MNADSDVEAVARFMQANIAAAKLVPVAEAIASLAPALWGRYGRDALVTLTLESEPISVPNRRVDATR